MLTTKRIVILGVSVITILGAIVYLNNITTELEITPDKKTTMDQTPSGKKSSLAELLHAKAGNDPLAISDMVGTPVEDIRLGAAFASLDKKYASIGERLIALKNNDANADRVRAEIDKEFNDLASLEARSLALGWWRNSYGIPSAPLDKGVGVPPVKRNTIKRKEVSKEL